MGRNWISQPGNLYATFLFSISGGPEVAAQISFVAALAVHDMVTALLPSLSPRIKWPNDVLIGGAKFCGVLAEVVGQQPTRIAIGCGVNVAHAPAGTPYPVTCLAAAISPRPRASGGEGRVRRWLPGVEPPAASPAESPPHPHMRGGEGAALALELVLHHLDEGLSSRLKMWDEGRGFPATRAAWEERALGLGGEVTANGMTGMFKGLAPDGALIMELVDGGRRHIHSGEVSFAELETLRRP